MPEPVIAIGVDAAERRLFERLAEEGRLPAIAELAADSGWGTVSSPASLGSGAVWPTFATGQPPAEHEFTGDHVWWPDRMALGRSRFDHLRPFWGALASAGIRSAVVDVPFAPLVEHNLVVEIADWGAHDWCGEGLRVRPSAMTAPLGDVLAPPHPLSDGPVDSAGPGDIAGLRDVIRSCREGVNRRGALACRLLDIASPDLLLVVFPEFHRASHLLWHTVDAAHPAWREGLPALPADVMQGLAEIAADLDRQVSRLAARARTVVLFSLHGMQPSMGIPACLDDLLERWGFAARGSWWQQPAARLTGRALRAAKRAIPPGLKAAYYRRTPRALTRRLSQTATPVGGWDWTLTRAFSLPSDQHGWLRLNLAGREARGIVPQAQYRATCDDLTSRLLALRSEEGALVTDVMPGAGGGGAMPGRLPDLVVHWSPATWHSSFRVLDPPLAVVPIGAKFVGQHDRDGFFVGRGLDSWPARVDAADLGLLIAGLPH